MQATKIAPNKSKSIDEKSLRVLELFSGIGGWKYAIENVYKNIEQFFPFDISPVANEIYYVNNGIVPCKTSIEKLSVKKLNVLDCNVWVLSPPCQPFTRNNETEKRDLNDPRARPLLHLISLLPNLSKKPQLIAMENVVGFEQSQCCQQWLKVLDECGYDHLQFILSPTQFGIPNERPRYYCLATLDSFVLDGATRCKGEILTSIPGYNQENVSMKALEEFLEFPNFKSCKTQNSDAFQMETEEPVKGQHTAYQSLMIPDTLLQKDSSWCFDIVSRKSTRSACFTKSYGRYAKGTGSVLYIDDPSQKDAESNDNLQKPGLDEDVEDGKLPCRKRKHSDPMFEQNDFLQHPSERCYEKDWQLKFYGKLRYFSPVEIKRLMCFPENMSFPVSMNRRKQYLVLGNSLNVQVAQELLAFAIHNSEECLSNHK